MSNKAVIMFQLFIALITAISIDCMNFSSMIFQIRNRFALFSTIDTLTFIRIWWNVWDEISRCRKWSTTFIAIEYSNRCCVLMWLISASDDLYFRSHSSQLYIFRWLLCIIPTWHFYWWLFLNVFLKILHCALLSIRWTVA
jgi:hypothetical protein